LGSDLSTEDRRRGSRFKKGSLNLGFAVDVGIDVVVLEIEEEVGFVSGRFSIEVDGPASALVVVGGNTKAPVENGGGL
jgi:hypothetical protein